MSMKTKIVIPITLLFFGVIGVGLDYFNIVDYPIGDPMSNIAISIIIVSTLLFFVKEQVLSLWLKFAYFWLPLTLLFVLVSPPGGGGFLPPMATRETNSLLLAKIFVVLSVAIIAYKSYKLRK